MGRLEGKVAIISGVSHAGQAGFALAKAFAREGADLVISARSEERVNVRAKELHELGANVIAVVADLTSEEGAKELIASAQGAYESIDILVNLAGGLTKFGPSDELTLADWQAELNNNLLSAFLCTRAVWPVMRSQGGGNVLNFSRAGGVAGSSAHMLAYNCAKAGIDALTYTFAKEGKPLNIRVNAIGPGLLITESNVQALKPSQEVLAKNWVCLEQVAEAAIFLVSPVADGINGVILPVNRG